MQTNFVKFEVDITEELTKSITEIVADKARYSDILTNAISRGIEDNSLAIEHLVSSLIAKTIKDPRLESEIQERLHKLMVEKILKKTEHALRERINSLMKDTGGRDVVTRSLAKLL